MNPGKRAEHLKLSAATYCTRLFTKKNNSVASQLHSIQISSCNKLVSVYQSHSPIICKRDQFKLLFLEWRMAYLSKNKFRIKGSKRHYFDLRTCWKISSIFLWHRENTGEWGKRELRSTLNWKSDAAFIDQFLSIYRECLGKFSSFATHFEG